MPLGVPVDPEVKLIRAGNELKGCCPFHADRSPSFTIFAGGERFHCFGCGAHGNAID
ncbi:MAG: virulence-associated protein E, partial [Sphingopyxis terrae]|nr:virulence-associated protein E [Sphingopyxis terrae]